MKQLQKIHGAVNLGWKPHENESYQPNRCSARFPRVRNPSQSQCCDRGRLKPKRFDASKLHYAADNLQIPPD